MIFVLLLLIDQVLKFLTLRSGSALINKGIAFGFFSSFSSFKNYNLSALFIFFLCIFTFYCLLFNIRKSHSKTILPLKLILVGGLSNLLDRIFYGGVVDYLHFPIIPMFNLADMTITLGFVILIKKILAPTEVG